MGEYIQKNPCPYVSSAIIKTKVNEKNGNIELPKICERCGQIFLSPYSSKYMEKIKEILKDSGYDTENRPGNVCVFSKNEIRIFLQKKSEFDSLIEMDIENYAFPSWKRHCEEIREKKGKLPTIREQLGIT